jgi:hypothetical protein
MSHKPNDSKLRIFLRPECNGAHVRWSRVSGWLDGAVEDLDEMEGLAQG